jgi:MerR family transcriptional regulator, light-induced transcriptional regulator
MDKASKGHSGTAAPASSAGALTEAASEKRLLTLVEAEIIPRLMLAHRDSRHEAQDTAIRSHEVATFARALLSNHIPDATELIGQLCERGVKMEAIYLQLLAPAARYLGELWEADQCNFSEVTLCLWRMQTLMYDLSAAFHGGDLRPTARSGAERRILVASLPGQQHTFGLSMLSEFFRKDGWVVLAIPSPQAGEVQDSLSMHWFDVLALSASMDGEVNNLTKTIKAARKTSRNPRLAVMVGGPLFLRQPGLAATVGADGMSEDAPSALALAGHLYQQQQEVRLN